MAKLDLDAIEAQANAATTLPILDFDDDSPEPDYRVLWHKGPVDSVEHIWLFSNLADAILFMHARAYVLALVARVRELEAGIRTVLPQITHYGYYTATGEKLTSDYTCPAHTEQGPCDCGADRLRAMLTTLVRETDE